MLGLMPAFQQYKVRLCHIKAQEVTLFCGGCIRSQAGDILLDSRLIHNCRTESDALCVRLLAMEQASQRYNVLPPAIFIHEVTVLNSVLVITGLDS